MTHSAAITRLVRDDAAAVAVTYALSLTALIVIAGVGFDYGRMAAMDSELQNGADQAALAGATQLNGASGACARAATAAASLVTNTTVLANSANTVTIPTETSCDAAGNVKFYQDRVRATAATSDANARFIEVTVATRTVDYAFTPIGGLIAGNGTATALAGLGQSVCKVPPMMICNPDPANPFNAAAKSGWGLLATGHGNNKSAVNPGATVSAWAPGDFGFLSVGSGQVSDLVKALAFQAIPLDCVPIDGSKPETGNPQALYDAINTRFDIYDFNGGNGTVLAPCLSGACPAAANVVKDVFKQDAGTSNPNDCKLVGGGANGWKLPDANRQFWPLATTATPNVNADGSYNDNAHSPSIDIMGLPKDLCHYGSYSQACSATYGGRLGNGNWARVDYFNKNHPGGERPASPATISRYETYKWEIAQNNAPYNAGPTKKLQFGRPICSTGALEPRDRRVLTVAVVNNCSSLSGGSVGVSVGEWVDVFLVEPSVDGRGNGASNDAIYMEIIGPTRLGSGGTVASQQIRRDVPYLIE